jgi:DNA-binding response OmpR family regulator
LIVSRDIIQNPLTALAVDDDPAVLAGVKLTLRKAGFTVWQADSGLTALSLLEEKGLPDIVIVDMNMPQMGGIEFCRVAQEYSDLPILMLTAVQETNAIVHVLTHVAEDYVIKPFRPPELSARVERILNRLGVFPYAPNRLVTVSDALQVDFVGQRVIVQGKTTALTPLETRLLYILMRQTGQTLSPDFLSRRLWPREISSDDRVRVTIHRLRQKLESNENSLTFIFTERGDGYRFLT